MTRRPPTELEELRARVCVLERLLVRERRLRVQAARLAAWLLTRHEFTRTDEAGMIQ